MKKQSTLYGLKGNSEIKIKYNLDEQRVTEILGSDCPVENAEISETKMFEMPTFISLMGTPFYPTKYELINEGEVSYCSSQMPNFDISFIELNPLRFRTKIRQYTIKQNEIEIYNAPNRPRKPSQNQVMGMSANDHVKELLDKGLLINNSKTPVNWHWCHLIGFSMFDSSKAQKKNNLFCGTAACNGHMTNIETAVKMFTCEYNRPLGLEVKAEYLMDTHVAIRISYRIYDKRGSMLSHTEYFDALTNLKSDVSDFRVIYDRMVKKFSEK